MVLASGERFPTNERVIINGIVDCFSKIKKRYAITFSEEYTDEVLDVVNKFEDEARESLGVRHPILFTLASITSGDHFLTAYHLKKYHGLEDVFEHDRDSIYHIVARNPSAEVLSYLLDAKLFKNDL